MPHDAQPASGTGLMQGAVTRVVTMIHVTHFVFQTIQNHFLEKRRKNRYIELFLAAEMHRFLFPKEKQGGKGLNTKSLRHVKVTLFKTGHSKGKEKGEPLQLGFFQERQQRPRLPTSRLACAKRHRELCAPRGPSRSPQRQESSQRGNVQVSQTKLTAFHFSKLPRIKLAGRFLLLHLHFLAENSASTTAAQPTSV